MATLRLKRPWPWMLLAGVKTSLHTASQVAEGPCELVAVRRVDMRAWHELVRSSAFRSLKVDAPFHWAMMPVGPVGVVEVLSCQREGRGGYEVRVKRIHVERKPSARGVWR